MRRVGRRMQVRGITRMDDHANFLDRHRDDVALLFRGLLIRVTTFFRDIEAFEVLKRKVIPKLLEEKGPDSAVRIAHRGWQEWPRPKTHVRPTV